MMIGFDSIEDERVLLLQSDPDTDWLEELYVSDIPQNIYQMCHWWCQTDHCKAEPVAVKFAANAALLAGRNLLNP